MMKKYYYYCVFLVALNVIMCGCHRAPRLSGLVTASGTLTHNDQSVAGATIMFAPAPGSPSDNRAASAITDASGKFSLFTLIPGDGAFPGTYRVMVSKTEAAGGGMVEGTEGDNPKFLDDRTSIDYLPKKYKDPETSGIEVTIPPKGTKTIEIKLEGEVDTTPQRIQRGRR
ncbi:MAG: carboxypeptidase-like regulatory domain-containing protein [Planctomycetaceae bacterium]|nr:carboxypeptidase-like regulatory domain-containing protein [Planctomycetaceae bacterium]